MGQEFSSGIFKHTSPLSAVQQFPYKENYRLKT
jgi:hypothetical protein